MLYNVTLLNLYAPQIYIHFIQKHYIGWGSVIGDRGIINNNRAIHDLTVYRVYSVYSVINKKLGSTPLRGL